MGPGLKPTILALSRSWSATPPLELFAGGKMISEKMDVIAAHISECIGEGGVVLIKGLGGMHLACDAFNEAAVEKLREVKKRDGKPFAVMFRDLESLKPYVKINKQEEQSLESWRSPVVLLEMKNIKGENNRRAGQTGKPMLAKTIKHS